MYFSVAGLESNVANLTRQFVEKAKNQANHHHDNDGCHFEDDDYYLICDEGKQSHLKEEEKIARIAKLPQWGKERLYSKKGII